ncbi:hypothetical protein [Microbacterium enclense]|uniref:hypothetical protein n=1 Tax=Microbacterium enclense TaxID=993073 RepID=UPI003F7FD8D9
MMPAPDAESSDHSAAERAMRHAAEAHLLQESLSAVSYIRRERRRLDILTALSFAAVALGYTVGLVLLPSAGGILGSPALLMLLLAIVLMSAVLGARAWRLNVLASRADGHADQLTYALRQLERAPHHESDRKLGS